MSDLLTKRASRGAAWLDQEKPGWAKQIQTERLDISEASCCVIGQIFGDFNDWFPTHKHTFVLRHGFDCTHRKGKNFDKLTKAWRAEVDRRLTV